MDFASKSDQSSWPRNVSKPRDWALFSWFQLSSTSALFLKIHDDVIKWKQYPYYWSFVMCVRGIHRSGSPVNSPHKLVIGESPHKHDKGPIMRPVNKRLSKQSWGWIFETPLHPLWRHCNVSGFSITYGGSKVTGTIYFGNWGTPVNKRIPHIFFEGPHMIISARAPYKYLEAPRIILGLTRTIYFCNWGIPINMKFPI